MALVTPTFDQMVEGIRRGVALAVQEAHARGLPVFEADDLYMPYIPMADVLRCSICRAHPSNGN